MLGFFPSTIVSCTSEAAGEDPDASAAVLERAVIVVWVELELADRRETKRWGFVENPFAKKHDWSPVASSRKDRIGCRCILLVCVLLEWMFFGC